MDLVKRLIKALFTREAALAIGAIASAIAALMTQLTTPGIFVDDPIQSLYNVGKVLAPLIGGWVTRYQVYSKQTVANITHRSVDDLPPPP